MSDVAPSNQQLSQMMGLVGSLAGQIQEMQQRPSKSEDWRAHDYRWKQCSGGKHVMQTLHYKDHNIVTPDHDMHDMQ